MTTEEANQIFENWKEYAEIDDKLDQIFGTSIPQSFLPYPAEVLEEALNIIAKRYFDTGRHEMSKAVQMSIIQVGRYQDDDTALDDLAKLLIMFSASPDLKAARLANLKRSRDSWARLK